MVGSLAKKINYENENIQIIDAPKEDLNWTTVSLSEVLDNGKRLEASVFDIESKHIRKVLANGRYPLTQLDGTNGLIKDSFYPGRFKRIYCEPGKGVEFYLPSQMTDIYPEPTKWISKLTKVSIEDLSLKPNTLLLTRSGTIGNVTIVSKTLEGKIFSDDVIRTTFKNEEDLGYVYAYLKTEYGSNILKTNSYGSVITHIEPEHLKEMLIPNPPKIIKQKIHDLIIQSFANRDKSNELIDQATQLLVDELELPPLEELRKEAFSYSTEINSFDIKLSNLDGRLEASYHVPITQTIEEHIAKKAELVKLNDARITKRIILPGRFKRVYVEKGNGKVFLGGKEIGQLDPANKKYLSLTHHSERIRNELTLKKDMILVTCSGTIGKVSIVPQHWESWTVNQHVLRVVSKKPFHGLIYTWLNSEYGKALISRQIYGSVVDEITDKQIGEVSVPILKDEQIRNYITELIDKANDLRYRAYQQEQEAIAIMNEEVLGL